MDSTKQQQGVNTEEFEIEHFDNRSVSEPYYRSVLAKEWCHSNCGQYETRAHVGTAGGLYYPGLEISYAGNDSDPEYFVLPHSTVEQAMEQARRIEARWHRDLNSDVDV